MNACENCGARNRPGSRFCANPNCGVYLGWDRTTMFPTGSPDPGQARQPGAGGRSAFGRQPAAQENVPDPSAYGVRLELAPPPAEELRAGEEIRIAATVENTGTVVDEFLLNVNSPAPWVRVEPDRVSVYPGQDEPVTVVLNPPPMPAPPAGPLPYRLVVRSAIRPNVTAVADGGVLVAAADGVTAEIAPMTVTGRGAKRARLLVRNDGNRPVLVALDRADREPEVTAQIAPAVLELLPKQSGEAAIRVAPRRHRWFGQALRHPYRLRVQPHPGTESALDGVFVQQPLIPGWVPRVAAVLVPVLAIGAVLLARNNNDDDTPTTPVAQSSAAGQPSIAVPTAGAPTTAAPTTPAQSMPQGAPTAPPMTSAPPTAAPTTTPPPTTAPPVTPYDLVPLADRAIYRSGAGPLPFNGSDGDNRGFALIRAPAPLTDGTTAPIALETHPQWVDDGFIEADFPLPGPIRRGDRFSTRIAFLAGAGGQVRYSVLAVGSDGTARELARKDLAATDPPADWEIDLSNAAGVRTLRLRVDAAGPASQDWALWIEPHVEARG